jgi:hypothetical protein
MKNHFLWTIDEEWPTRTGDCPQKPQSLSLSPLIRQFTASVRMCKFWYMIERLLTWGHFIRPTYSRRCAIRWSAIDQLEDEWQALWSSHASHRGLHCALAVRLHFSGHHIWNPDPRLWHTRRSRLASSDEHARISASDPWSNTVTAQSSTRHELFTLLWRIVPTTSYITHKTTQAEVKERNRETNSKAR